MQSVGRILIRKFKGSVLQLKSLLKYVSVKIC